MNPLVHERTVDVAVIGGGPAGLSAATNARRAGAGRVLVVERDVRAGGILPQCIHAGFGLHEFGVDLTGPEYADRWTTAACEAGVEVLLDTMVLSFTREAPAGGWLLSVVGPTTGVLHIHCTAVVLAMGCRERTRGALSIPGDRPSGIYTAGTAQRLSNLEGLLPGRRIVILGSGDIGLIMARRLTLEGARVLAVLELQPYAGGLTRNVVQCLDDFGIPLRLSTTVVRINGRERLEGVVTAQVDENRRPIPGTEVDIPCDTLLLSVGLIPENELSRDAGVTLDTATGGAVVDETLATVLPGVFACGNVLHVHDLVDYVSEEASLAGRSAARFALAAAGAPVPAPASSATPSPAASSFVSLAAGPGVRTVVPQRLRRDTPEPEPPAEVKVRFRVSAVFGACTLRLEAVAADGTRTLLVSARRRRAVPGEMEDLALKGASLAAARAAGSLAVSVEGDARG